MQGCEQPHVRRCAERRWGAVHGRQPPSCLARRLVDFVVAFAVRFQVGVAVLRPQAAPGEGHPVPGLSPAGAAVGRCAAELCPSLGAPPLCPDAQRLA
eukprot:5919290-Alexandrium_andersonii.AAC.1